MATLASEGHVPASFSSDSLDSSLLTALRAVRKHYDARYPSVPALIALPPSSSLAQWEVQVWLVENLIKPERALLVQLARSAPEMELELGAGEWRKAFWKRVVQEVETGIAESDMPEDNEVHEDILFALAGCMAEKATSSGTRLRRFHFGRTSANDGQSVYYSGQEETISIVEREATISQGTTGLRTWQASVRLCNHILAVPSLVTDRCVLELGSGAGLLSVLIGGLQATPSEEQERKGRLTATDREESVLQRLKANIQLNKQKNIDVRALDWADETAADSLPDFDLVIGSDLMYDPDLASLLVPCLARLLASSRGDELSRPKEALLAATVRNEDTYQVFKDWFDKYKLLVQEMEFSVPAEGSEIVGGFEEPARVLLLRVTTAPL